MELTSTNSPCVLFLEKSFHPYFNKIYQISLVAIEERVHPTPFRTRKLSSPSPMILHNVMWESRPLPKIVRRPPCCSQREGVFFYALPLVGATARSKRFLALHVILIVPGTSRGFFCWERRARRIGADDKRKGARNSFCPTVFSQANKLG